MARTAFVLLAACLLLGACSGAMALSLRAGGITAAPMTAHQTGSGSRDRVTKRALGETARVTTLGGTTAATDADGNPVLHKDGTFTTGHGVVETLGGRTVGYDDTGAPVYHQDGYARIAPDSLDAVPSYLLRRGLSEQAASAADARITTIGGTTAATDADRNPVLHKDGTFTTGHGVVETLGGRTVAYDDTGAPVYHQDGYARIAPDILDAVPSYLLPRSGFGK